MKILVIDNAGLITACLAAVDADLVCHDDEIQALNAAELQQPALVILSYAVRSHQTPDFIRLLLDVAPATSLVVVGDQMEENDVLRCLSAGAKGYQTLSQLPHYSIKLVNAVMDGEAWVSRKLVARLLEVLRQQNLADKV